MVIKMNIENSYSSETNNKETETGIGLENAGRRLELIYPRKYKLVTESIDNVYRVNLRINTA